MIVNHKITLLALISIVTGSFAIVTTRTMLEHRSKTSDFEYNLDLSIGSERKDDTEYGYSSRTLNRISAPILAMKDVQSSIEYLKLKVNGSSDGTHYHPRSAEVCYVEHGNVTATLIFTNGTGTGIGMTEKKYIEIKNAIGKHGVALIPQGVPHKLDCISQEGCAVLSYYNSADPGRI